MRSDAWIVKRNRTEESYINRQQLP